MAQQRSIAIIGAGPGGICAARMLLLRGHTDFVVFEQAPAVGGTWWHNRYPGAACDVPSALYSFSFAPKHDWSRPYAPQPEIHAYVESVARDAGVLPHVRLSTKITGAVWNDETCQWTLSTSDQDTHVFDIVISAIGMFNDLAFPAIDGLDAFAGTVMHTACWNTDHSTTGERIAVIGSAASAVQLIPVVAQTAAKVHVFQRTANWVLPKLDTPYTEAELAARADDLTPQRVERDETYTRLEKLLSLQDEALLAKTEAFALAVLETVENETVRAHLTPTHPFGCKRPLLSNDWHAAFNRDNVELVVDSIERITASGVVTADQVERDVDTIVLATGFEATKFLSAIDVCGRDGVRIADAWNDGAEAYLGITTNGFPNLFMLYGPNTNNGSLLTMLEHQVAYIEKFLDRMGRDGVRTVEVRAEVVREYNEALQDDLDRVAVWQAGCNGYYRSASGRIVTQWPHDMTEYGRRTHTVDWDSFALNVR